jgi:hypothetical protein
VAFPSFTSGKADIFWWDLNPEPHKSYVCAQPLSYGLSSQVMLVFVACNDFQIANNKE